MRNDCKLKVKMSKRVFFFFLDIILPQNSHYFRMNHICRTRFLKYALESSTLIT